MRHHRPSFALELTGYLHSPPPGGHSTLHLASRKHRFSLLSSLSGISPANWGSKRVSFNRSIGRTRRLWLSDWFSASYFLTTFSCGASTISQDAHAFRSSELSPARWGRLRLTSFCLRLYFFDVRIGSPGSFFSL